MCGEVSLKNGGAQAQEEPGFFYAQLFRLGV
jgi:hypothetical protein